MQQAEPIESTASSFKVRVLAIAPDQVQRIWPMAEPCLAKATRLSPKIDTDDIYQECVLPQGSMRLWLAVEDETAHVYAALVTDLCVYHTGWKVARILACGGERLWRWKQSGDDAITAYAKAEGCDAIEIVGKDFWEHVFSGFVEIERVFSRELNHD